MPNELTPDVGNRAGGHPVLTRLLTSVPMSAATRRMIRGTAERKGYDMLFHLFQYGLYDTGWLRSSRARRPVDVDGGPIPWYTYGATEFLDARLRPDMTVFEFGAGQSTLWYAPRVSKVRSVDHDGGWVRDIGALLPANATIELHTDERSYLGAIGDEPVLYDLICIDGGFDRVASALAAVPRLSPAGVLLWDNSDDNIFHEARRAHAQLGAFRELPFWGLGPMVPRMWSTSILYRPENCLGI